MSDIFLFYKLNDVNNENNVIYIEIEKLKPHPKQDIFVSSDDDTLIEILKNDIKQTGLINPLIINKDYIILSGQKRYKALKMLNYKIVPVIIKNFNNEEEEFSFLIKQNTIRKNVLKTTRHKIYESILNKKVKEISTKEAKILEKLTGINYHTIISDIQKEKNKNPSIEEIKYLLEEKFNEPVNIHITYVNDYYICKVIVRRKGEIFEIMNEKLDYILKSIYQRIRSGVYDQNLKSENIKYGSMLRDIREKLKMKQSEFSHFLGISQNYLCELERGYYNSVKEYYDLACELFKDYL